MPTINNEQEFIEVSKAFGDSLTPLQRQIFEEIVSYYETKVFFLKASAELLRSVLEDPK